MDKLEVQIDLCDLYGGRNYSLKELYEKYGDSRMYFFSSESGAYIFKTRLETNEEFEIRLNKIKNQEQINLQHKLNKYKELEKELKAAKLL